MKKRTIKDMAVIAVIFSIAAVLQTCNTVPGETVCRQISGEKICQTTYHTPLGDYVK